MTAATTLMDRLRDDTRELHAAAEQTEFQQALMGETLPRDLYVRSLEQLWLIHAALEKHLRNQFDRRPAFKNVLRDYQFQEPYLREDLSHFGRPLDRIRPEPAVTELTAIIDRAAAQQPDALLGFHYVLEGSKNGAKFQCEKVRRAYRLNGAAGTRYLDPYGPQQRGYWQTFRQDMNAAEFPPTDADAIVHAAGTMFKAITRLYRDLYPSKAASVSA